MQLLHGVVPKNPGFTAVILAYEREDNLKELMELLERCPSLQKIVVVWNNQERMPPHGMYIKSLFSILYSVVFGSAQLNHIL